MRFNCLLTLQELPKTSGLFAQVKRVLENLVNPFTSRAAPTTGLSQVLWPKVETLQKEMEQVESPYTEKSLKMKTLSTNILVLAFCQWLTLVKIPTVLNSSFALMPSPILMTNMSFSVKCLRVLKFSV